MAAFGKLSEALALLRKQRGLKLAELGNRQGVTESTASRMESNAEALRVATLERHLAALGATYADLGAALDEVNGVVRASGKPRPRWISGLTLRPRFDVDSLVGFLLGVLDPEDPAAGADFVASVEETARGLALEALRQATATANVLPHPAKLAADATEREAERHVYSKSEVRSWNVNEEDVPPYRGGKPPAK